MWNKAEERQNLQILKCSLVYNSIYERKQSLLSINTLFLIKLMNQAKKSVQDVLDLLERKRRGILDAWKQMSETTAF